MNSVTKIFANTIKTDHKIITEEAAKSILKKYKVSVPGFSLATSADQAVKDAKRLGFPLVMKVVSPQILHKTDVGGVKVGIDNTADVKKTFNDMYGRLSKKKGVKILSYFIQSTTTPHKSKELIDNFQVMYGKEASFIDPKNVNEVTKTLNSLFLERNLIS